MALHKLDSNSRLETNHTEGKGTNADDVGQDQQIG